MDKKIKINSKAGTYNWVGIGIGPSINKDSLQVQT